MHRSRSVHVQGACIVLLWAGAVAGCGSGSAGHAPAGASNHVDGGSTLGDATMATGSSDSGTAMGGAHPSPDGSPPGQSAMTSPDGSVVPFDDGGADGGGADGGPGIRDVGSCCAEQGTPGCSNPDLEVCVCEKIQSCCTTAWTLDCVLVVQQKYCQPNVRDCVCGTDAGQWGQTACCKMDWTSTCDSVATLKCNAVQGCF
jgi:hypothetical protein